MTAGDVERLAQALGVWRDGGRAPGAGRIPLGRQWVMWAAPWTKSGDCKFWLRRWEPASTPSWGDGWSTRPAEDRGPFDPQTAALLLLGHARGLVVDVGECPACRYDSLAMQFESREAARQWCRDNGQPSRLVQPMPAAWSDHSPPDRSRSGWWGLWIGDGHVRAQSLGRIVKPTRWARPDDFERPPCQHCSGSGRHTHPWAEAVLLARGCKPLRAEVGKRIVPMTGDAPTREALAVLADRMQAHPDPCGLCHGKRWAYQVDAVGPGVTLEQMNPRRVPCSICRGKGIDEHGEAKMLLGQCVAAWLGGVLGDMQDVLDRLVASAILNAE